MHSKSIINPVKREEPIMISKDMQTAFINFPILFEF